MSQNAFNRIVEEQNRDEALREHAKFERDVEAIGNVIARDKVDIEILQEENAKLKRAARLIHDRHAMISGSLAMAECDALCKSVGLAVWTWPSHGCDVK